MKELFKTRFNHLINNVNIPNCKEFMKCIEVEDEIIVVPDLNMNNKVDVKKLIEIYSFRKENQEYDQKEKLNKDYSYLIDELKKLDPATHVVSNIVYCRNDNYTFFSIGEETFAILLTKGEGLTSVKSKIRHYESKKLSFKYLSYTSPRLRERD